MKTSILLASCCCLAVTALAHYAIAQPPDHAAVLARLKTYHFGDDAAPLDTVTQWVNAARANPNQKGQTARELADVLHSDAPFDAKQFVCRELVLIAGPEQVPVLTEQLPNDQLAHYALMVLARIPGAGVDEALTREVALTHGPTQLEVINTLGERRVTGAASALTPLLTSPDAAVGEAAAAALGKLDDGAALEPLRQAYQNATGAHRLAFGQALLVGADRLQARGAMPAALAIYQQLNADAANPQLNAGGLRGLLLTDGQKNLPLLLESLGQDGSPRQSAALAFVRESKSTVVTQGLSERLPKLSTMGQRLLLAALGERGDAAALSAVTSLAHSADSGVALAAVDTLGALGDAMTVPVLLELASAGATPQRAAARLALARLHGHAVDTKLLGLLDGAPVPTRVEIINSLGQRLVTTAVPRLAQATRSPQPAIVAAAVGVLRDMGRPQDLPALLDILPTTPIASRPSVVNAIAEIARRAPEENGRTGVILARLKQPTTPAVKADLLAVLSRVGGPSALATLRAATTDTSPAVRLSALRLLANWPTAEPLDDLWRAANTTGDEAPRVVALRGYIRLLGLDEGAAPAAAVAHYRRAIDLDKNPEVKRLALAGLAKLKSKPALDYAASFMTDAAVRPEAELATVEIAASTLGAWRDETRAILMPIANGTGDENARQKARDLLAASAKASEYVLTWEAAPAYQQAGMAFSQLFNIPFAPEDPAQAKSVVWRLMPTGTNAAQPWLIDLLALWGGESRVSYLRTAVWSEIAHDAVLELGSDDGVKGWLNGQIIVADNAQRAIAPGQDKVKAQLKPGWNGLMLKITQNNQGWGACARFANADGSALTGLRYAVPSGLTGADTLSAARNYTASPVAVPVVASAPATPVATAPVGIVDKNWKKIVLDKKFRSEGVAVADVNHDGQPDVLVGDLWYEAPNWTPHEIRAPKDYGDGSNGYSEAFLCFAYDVNGDGWPDLVVIGFPGKPCYWYENPRNQPGHWPEHLIWHSACDETPNFVDLFGDGKKELVMATQPEAQMAWFAPDTDVTKPWRLHPISPEHTPGTEQFTHGLGYGDINGDGRNDVIVRQGWWEQPADAKTSDKPWTFHPANLGFECANMYAFDVDGDGLNDVFSSSAHQKGVWWHQQVPGKGGAQFTQHLITDAFSESHSMNFVDINGDGQKDLITGKRWWAHGPNGDIDPNAAPVLVWIEIKKQPGAAPQFIVHQIDDASGIGTQFTVADVNGDGAPDIVVSNKRGVFVFEQMRAKR